MKKISIVIAYLLICCAGNGAAAPQERNNHGLLVERYDTHCRNRSGIAHGGIGAGFIELRRNGQFYNWSIFNNYPKETGPAFHIESGKFEEPEASFLFFMVRYQVEGQAPRLKLLQLPDGLNEGGINGSIYYYPWLSSVDCIEYSARFPFSYFTFTDAEMPFEIKMKAWSPFIPHDVKNSSLPLVYFDFEIVSQTDQDVDVMLMASMRNMAGYDIPDRYYQTEVVDNKDMTSIVMSCGNVPEDQSSYGQMALSSLNDQTTYYAGWSYWHPYYTYLLRHQTLPDLNDTDGVASIGDSIPAWMPHTNGRNQVNEETGKKQFQIRGNLGGAMSTVAVSETFHEKGSLLKNTFAVTWNFPNLYAEKPNHQISTKKEGHYYNNFFSHVSEITNYAGQNHAELGNQSQAFLDHFFDSSLDLTVLEQINSQLNTFVASGRLVKDGSFGVQEGLAPNQSWGPVATIDVSLYGSIPIITLFPELQKATMEAHRRLQNEKGEIAHGLHKDFRSWEDGTFGVSHRIDLPGQFMIMTLRDYFWTGDKAYLERMWPHILRAMDFVLSHNDANHDLMPDMEGPRSSYDNFPMFGLASYIQSQWLCAMASVIPAADVMDDPVTKKKAVEILEKGKVLMDTHLWNGSYYALYHDYDGSMKNHTKDETCLSDQIIGQWVSHGVGLGYLLDEKKVKTAIRSILKHNFQPGFGLRNASMPGIEPWETDIIPHQWVDQGNTCWTGVELAFASFCIYEGLVQEGLDIIKTVDARYRKAGLYWDHQEFGGHYYRPMSAWAILNAILGFTINQQSLHFNPGQDNAGSRYFFATPEATAHFSIETDEIKISVRTGTLNVRSLSIQSRHLQTKRIRVQIDGQDISCQTQKKGKRWSVKFEKPISVEAESEIVCSGVSS